MSSHYQLILEAKLSNPYSPSVNNAPAPNIPDAQKDKFYPVSPRVLLPESMAFFSVKFKYVTNYTVV